MCWRLAFLVGLLGSTWQACAPLEEGPFCLDLEGQRVAVLDTTAVATVVIFVRSDCPISNRYAPEIERLQQDYDASGVRLFLVYPDPDETSASIRQHAAEYGLSLQSLRDGAHELVDHVSATVTPSAAVFVAGKLIYSGCIDDRYTDLGRSRPEPSRRHLREVLDGVIAGDVPAMHRTRAVGCLIADLR